MKMLITFFAGLMMLVLLAACSTVPTANQTPAQVAAQVCPQLQAVHDAFVATPGLLTQDEQDKLARAEPIVARVCAAATAAPSKPDLKAVAAVAVPVLLDVVQASTLPGQTKLQITLGVNIAKSLIAQQLAEESAEASAPVTSLPASASQ